MDEGQGCCVESMSVAWRVYRKRNERGFSVLILLLYDMHATVRVYIPLGTSGSDSRIRDGNVLK